MAVAIAWLPGPAGTRRRVATPSVEEPDAAEPARPDLWGARVSNDPGLPDRSPRARDPCTNAPGLPRQHIPRDPAAAHGMPVHTARSGYKTGSTKTWWRTHRAFHHRVAVGVTAQSNVVLVCIGTARLEGFAESRPPRAARRLRRAWRLNPKPIYGGTSRFP